MCTHYYRCIRPLLHTFANRVFFMLPASRASRRVSIDFVWRLLTHLGPWDRWKSLEGLVSPFGRWEWWFCFVSILGLANGILLVMGLLPGLHRSGINMMVCVEYTPYLPVPSSVICSPSGFWCPFPCLCAGDGQASDKMAPGLDPCACCCSNGNCRWGSWQEKPVGLSTFSIGTLLVTDLGLAD